MRFVLSDYEVGVPLEYFTERSDTPRQERKIENTLLSLTGDLTVEMLNRVFEKEIQLIHVEVDKHNKQCKQKV